MSEPAQTAGNRESGWLIENYFKSATNKPLWFRMFSYKQQDQPTPEWTEESSVAMRFARESDAAWMAMLYPKMCCLAHITEHVWFGGEHEQE